MKNPQPYAGGINDSGRISGRYEETEEEQYLDRLSCLPDGIIAHLLSFLDTRSAVATSVLSKRYQHLWTLSPSLYFKLPRFALPYRGHWVSVPSAGDVFQSFVCRVLLRREHGNVENFRLSLHDYVTPGFIRYCIDYAARHKVRHLRVRALWPGSVALPDTLLTCSSLVTLRLHSASLNSIELPKSVLWPNLRVLHLKKFEFSEHLGGDVFSGCPSLQTLVLCKCSIRPGNKLTSLEVNCLNLETLEVRHWRSPWTCFDEHMIRVNAPRLASFKLKGYLVRICFSQGCPCLEQVYVDLRLPTACYGLDLRERKKKTCESFLWMLRQLCRTRLLALSLQTTEILRSLQVLEPIVFDNLRLIKFTAEDKFSEVIIRVELAMQHLNAGKLFVFFYGSKEKRRIDDGQVSIPRNVMHFLLESSPSVEYLCIELPKVSSDQNGGGAVSCRLLFHVII